MIDLTVKKALIIDLENKIGEVKSFTDINKYFGGVGVGLKLLETYISSNPIIISIGPLNGFFPFASKTSIVLSDGGLIEDIYMGGSLSTRMRFAGLDSIVIYGRSNDEVILNIENTKVTFLTSENDINSLGLPGKRCVVSFDKKNVLLDGYFTTPDNYLEEAFLEKNLSGLVITGTEVITINRFDEYSNLYNEILNKSKELRVDKGAYLSCSNCPMGCGKSKTGEVGGNVLINSLVACQFADRIYTDVGVVFSCLNTLGYEYTHEDIENLPKLIEETLKRLS